MRGEAKINSRKPSDGLPRLEKMPKNDLQKVHDKYISIDDSGREAKEIWRRVAQRLKAISH